LAAIAKARAYLDDLVAGRVLDIAEIAAREQRSVRSASMLRPSLRFGLNTHALFADAQVGENEASEPGMESLEVWPQNAAGNASGLSVRDRH
jgi:hypothetical protein